MGYMRDWRGNRIDRFDPMRDLRDLAALWRFTDLDPGSHAVGDNFYQHYCKANRGGDLLNDTSNVNPVKVGSGLNGRVTIRTSATDMLCNLNFGVAGDLAWGYPPIEGEYTLAALFKADSSFGLGQQRTILSGTAYGKAQMYCATADGHLSIGGPFVSAQGGPSPCDDAWHLAVARVTPRWTDVWLDGYFLNGSIIAAGSMGALLVAVAQGATSCLLPFSFASGTVLNIGAPGTETYETVTTSGTPTGSGTNWTTTVSAFKFPHAGGEKAVAARQVSSAATLLRGIGVGGQPGQHATTMVGEFAEVMVLRRPLFPDEILAYTLDRFTTFGLDTSHFPTKQGALSYSENVTDTGGQSVTVFDPNRGVA